MKFILTVFLLVGGYASLSQNKTEYVFYKNLAKKVADFLNGQIDRDSSNQFYFILDHSSSEKNGDAMKLFIGTYKVAPIYVINDIIKVSSRYYKFKGKEIPICFDYDFRFISHGKSDKGNLRMSPTGETFCIEFSKTDRILGSGY